MTWVTDAVAGGTLSAREWPRKSAALLCAVILCLGAFGYFASSYVLHSRLVAEQDSAIQRIASANVDLQEALERLRNDTQRTLEQLRAENSLLRTRVSELEQSASQEPNTQATSKKGNRKMAPARTAAQTVDGASGTVASEAPAAVQARAIVAVVNEGSANFTAPRWVPNYFSNESGSLTSSLRPGRVRTGDL